MKRKKTNKYIKNETEKAIITLVKNLTLNTRILKSRSALGSFNIQKIGKKIYVNNLRIEDWNGNYCEFKKVKI